MENIELYNYSITYPTPDALQKLGKMAFLVYVTPFVASMVEYAGRTCYKSFDKIKENSYKNFIKNIVNSGHESVIEHSNLVYVVFKPQGAKNKDADRVNRYMITLMMYNGLLNVSENQACYLISGNIRMFKDLIRKYYEIKAKNNKSNPILDDITKSFYELPDYFFGDMIGSKILDETKFKPNPKLITNTTSFNCKQLNDYVSVLNHDRFFYKIKGFKSTDDKGNTLIKKFNIPNQVLLKHNRLTIVIKAPRYITHQIVRHRPCSYSQVSLRYTEATDVDVYMPNSFKEKHMEALANSIFKTAFDGYKVMLDAGVQKGDARSLLPMATMSTIVMTATIEEFNHFVVMRADPAAQNFIREMIAIPLRDYLKECYDNKTGNSKLHMDLVQTAMDSSTKKYVKRHFPSKDKKNPNGNNHPVKKHIQKKFTNNKKHK